MIQSMTAFASRTGALEGTTWVWDMRGVNGRGLDIRLRIPDGLPGLEAQVREALKKALTRGNVNVTLRLQRDDSAQTLALDTAQLDRVLAALDEVQERAFSAGVTLAQPTAADVLQARGVVLNGTQETDSAPLVAALNADFEALVVEFAAMRAAEGEALHAVVTGQIAKIAELVDAAEKAAEDRKPQMRAVLKDAIDRVVSEFAETDAARLAQELAIIATKQDVTEEIDRLRAHIGAAREMLSHPPAGRKLDFLAQEFNREVNTLCSKSQNTALTAVGLEFKVVVDQMREQVQNVE